MAALTDPLELGHQIRYSGDVGKMAETFKILVCPLALLVEIFKVCLFLCDLDKFVLRS